jgi:hypothetical protein
MFSFDCNVFPPRLGKERLTNSMRGQLRRRLFNTRHPAVD